MRNLSFPTTLLWLLFVVSCAQATEHCDTGYLFTCPRSLKTGVYNELQLKLYGASVGGSLTVTVFASDSYDGNKTVLSEDEFVLEEGENESVHMMFLPSPDQYVYNGEIRITIRIGNCSFGGSEEVYFSKGTKTLCLIQTDKPIYKPGQDVLCRVLLMNSEFKPMAKSEVDVSVEDPQGITVTQWKRVPLGSGMKQLEFPLDDQTTKGIWKILTSIDGEQCSSTFEVKEYVLPKFEVKIEIPSYVLSNAEEIPIKIYANYTYGKPVKGILNMNVSLEKYSWSTEKMPTIEYSGEIYGVFSYIINVSLVETDNFYRYRRLQVVASVTEYGTEVERNETKYIQRTFSPLQLSFNQDMRQYFKPGLPFNGELKVTYPDNTPAEGEDIEICAEKSRERIMNKYWLAQRKVEECRNYTSGPDGGIKFTLPPQNTDTISIHLKAKALNYVRDSRSNDRHNSLSQPQTSMSLTPWYSPSGSFIQLQLEDDVVKCGEKKEMKLLFTSQKDAEFDFQYQVIYQGRVLQSGSVQKSFSVEDDVSSQYQDQDKLLNERETQISPPPQSSDNSSSDSSDDQCSSVKEAKYVPPIGEATFEIDVDASLSPVCYLLVYYIRDDTETIADSQKLKVEKCLKNEVEFAFGDEVKQPGTKTSIHVSSAPNSLCGIKVVDKSVFLLDSRDQVTKDSVFSLKEGMDNGMYYSVNHCNKKIPQPGLYKASSPSIMPPRPYSSSQYEDGMTAFENSGLLVISNQKIFTRLCKNNRGGGNIVYDAQMESAGYTFSANGGHGGLNRKTVALSTARRPAAPVAAKVGVEATKSVVNVRTYFPETWLFTLKQTDQEGTFVEKVKLPHTITEWRGNAICINDKDGLGISDIATMKAFQAFFLSFTLPYSVVRGEIFVVVVSVFNYVDKALPITVTLDQPVGYEIVNGSANKDICIEPQSTYTLRIQVKATELGQVNMTIHGETSQSNDACGSSEVADTLAKDAITNSFLVEAEGWPAEVVQTYLVKPEDEENGVYKTTFEQDLPEDYVEGSATARIDVCGNIMGPSLNNLENLVTVPTGCGEQNMARFIPNMVALNYLEETGQLTEQLKKRAVRNLNTGAQRQMQYRHSDGSYSAFGYRDRSGSMFLTALVLRSFSEAKKYISIDNNTLTQMQDWIVSKQNQDGCFPDIGKIIDYQLFSEINKESNGTITAYCLASLLISGYENTTVIDAAMKCMNQEPKENLNAYSLMLRAYALSLAGKDEAAQEQIEYVEENYSNKTGGALHFNVVNGTRSQTLETAGYAVMTMLEIGRSPSKVLPIIQYMTLNMNRNGGYTTTQDTCVVITSLGEFATKTNSEPVNIDVTYSGPIDKKISITEDNKLVCQRNYLKNEPTGLTVEAKGTGYFLVQYVTRYHTTNPPEKRKFKIEAVGECKENDCKRGTVTVTVSYVPKEMKAGMTIVRINMISGMVPVKESLDALSQNKDLKVMRMDVEDNNVICYFSNITNTPKVITIEVMQAIEVENTVPSKVEVENMYNREESASTNYSLGVCDESSSCSTEN